MRLIALFFIFSATTAFCAHAQEKPNVIIFFMDDMGYGDSRAYNPESKVSLPNIERLCLHMACDSQTRTAHPLSVLPRVTA